MPGPAAGGGPRAYSLGSIFMLSKLSKLSNRSGFNHLDRLTTLNLTRRPAPWARSRRPARRGSRRRKAGATPPPLPTEPEPADRRSAGYPVYRSYQLFLKNGRKISCPGRGGRLYDERTEKESPMKTTYARLAEVLETRYGVGALAAPPVAVLWATDALADDVGRTQAERELAALNRRRNRVGKIPASREALHA